MKVVFTYKPNYLNPLWWCSFLEIQIRWRLRFMQLAFQDLWHHIMAVIKDPEHTWNPKALDINRYQTQAMTELTADVLGLELIDSDSN